MSSSSDIWLYSKWIESNFNLMVAYKYSKINSLLTVNVTITKVNGKRSKKDPHGKYEFL